jgi:putative membrane protein
METTWLQPALTGIPAHLLFFVVALGAVALFIAIYTAITPYREIPLIRAGNSAAAVSLGGAILGYSVPLAQSVAQSGSLGDMLVWSGVGLAAQLFAFGVTRLILPQLVTDVREGKIAPAIFLAALSIAIGILNAAAMSDGLPD